MGAKKHGCTETRLYRIWRNMKTRCNCVTDSHYPRWGGRGIKVCSGWNNSFIEFQKWALANGYQDNLTIDRIDNNKGYCPENCRWTTLKEQSRNTRNNHYLTFNGETHCINEWAEITGLSRDLIKDRILKLHWTIEDALTTPRLTRNQWDNKKGGRSKCTS